ncbi:MAG: YfhO family protein [Candidatus Hydrogenedentota bacterium]
MTIHGAESEGVARRQWSGWLVREGLPLAALIVAACVLVFPGVFLRGEVISPADVLFHMAPWAEYAPPGWEASRNLLMVDVITVLRAHYTAMAGALEAGEWPLWNPLQLTGIPLLANYISAVLYPPRLLFAVFSTDIAKTVYLLAQLSFCGLSAYVCARGLKLTPPMARLAAAAWMLASYNLVWAQWTQTEVTPWLPIAFLGTEWIVQRRLYKGFYALLAGGLLMLLAGHPQNAFAAGLGLAVYFLFRLALERHRLSMHGRAAGVFAAAWGLALLTAMGQILPFAEYLANAGALKERPGTPDVDWLTPGAVVSLWVPRFFGAATDGNHWGENNANYHSMLYCGMLAWCGAALLLAHGKRAALRARQGFALAGAAGVSFLLAFNAPPLQWVHELPGFNTIHIAYHSTFALFALPLLGVMGIAFWLKQDRAWRQLWPAAIPAALGAIVVMTAWLFFEGRIQLEGLEAYTRTQIGLAALFLGLSALVLALPAAASHLKETSPWRGRVYRAVPLAALMVLSADLLVHNRNLNPTLPAEHVFPDTAVTDYLLKQPDPIRVATGEAGIPSAILPTYGIEEWLGYDSLHPARIVRLQETLGERIWGNPEPVRAVTHILHNPAYPPTFPLEEHPERFTLEAELDGIEIYRNEAALPRAFLTGSYEVHQDVDALFARMLERDFDPAETVLLEEEPPDGFTPHPAGKQGTAEVAARTHNTVTISAEAPAPAMLVLADAYYPGWRATLNGEPVPILPAYHAFRAVALPEGEHEIVFRYAPASHRWGIGLSLAGMALGGALPFVRRPQRSS